MNEYYWLAWPILGIILLAYKQWKKWKRDGVLWA